MAKRIKPGKALAASGKHKAITKGISRPALQPDFDQMPALLALAVSVSLTNARNSSRAAPPFAFFATQAAGILARRLGTRAPKPWAMGTRRRCPLSMRRRQKPSAMQASLRAQQFFAFRRTGLYAALMAPGTTEAPTARSGCLPGHSPSRSGRKGNPRHAPRLSLPWHAAAPASHRDSSPGS